MGSAGEREALSPWVGRSFPLGLELGVAALRRRRTRRLHYSMSSWQ
jgi:hypothetical protein